MINIRYHIVSITAVFLALGIGIALGSTFLDGATVDVLNRNITDAETRIREGKDRIAELEAQVDDARARDEAMILLGTDRLLGEQLAEQPVLVVASPDAADGDLDALRSVLERSGADLRGTLELSDRLAFEGDEVDAELASALGLDDPTPQELRSAVDAALVEALREAGRPGDDDVPAGEEPGATPADPTTTTTSAPADPAATTTTEAGTTTTTEAAEDGLDEGEQPAIVTALLEGGYLELQPGPGGAGDAPILAEPGYRYVYVGGPSPDPGDTDLLLALLPGSSAGDALPAVVASGTAPTPSGEGEEPEPTIVARVRADDDLASRYTTIDDLETFSGLAATVFSLADLGAVPVGHYGQADGASAVLPPDR